MRLRISYRLRRVGGGVRSPMRGRRSRASCTGTGAGSRGGTCGRCSGRADHLTWQHRLAGDGIWDRILERLLTHA